MDVKSVLCSICLNSLNVNESVASHCGHIFHHDCVDECVQRSPTCPSCKKSIDTDYLVTLSFTNEERYLPGGSASEGDNKRADSQQQINTLNNMLDNLQKRYQTLLAGRDELAKRLLASNEENSTLRMEISELKAQNNSQCYELGMILKNIDELTDGNAALTQQYRSNEQMLTTLLAEKQPLFDENLMLKNQLADLSDQNAHLNLVNRDLRKANAQLREKRDCGLYGLRKLAEICIASQVFYENEQFTCQFVNVFKRVITQLDVSDCALSTKVIMQLMSEVEACKERSAQNSNKESSAQNSKLNFESRPNSSRTLKDEHLSEAPIKSNAPKIIGQAAKCPRIPTVQFHQGEHPISLLLKLCDRRHWPHPKFDFTMNSNSNPHTYHCTVSVNGVMYESDAPSIYKKVAKASAAAVCLKALGRLPHDYSLI